MAEPMTKVMLTIRWLLIPIASATAMSWAAARMASPSSVFVVMNQSKRSTAAVMQYTAVIVEVTVTPAM